MKNISRVCIGLSVFALLISSMNVMAGEKEAKGKLVTKQAYSSKELKRAYKNQIEEVKKKYPAVAITLARQEVVLAAAIAQRKDVEYFSETLNRSILVSSTTLGLIIETELRIQKCIDNFVRCDLHAGSDGVHTVDEVNGCGRSFSSCWTGN